MMLGYGFGKIISEPLKRKKLCWWIGGIAVFLFIIIDMVIYLRTTAHKQPLLYDVLNQQKYPPSQLFLLMTLGPLILFIPFAETVKGKIPDIFLMLGRVPLFYYILHIPLIHLLAMGVNYLREGDFHQAWYIHAPFTEIQATHRWGLPLLYMVFLVAEVILYYCCRIYAKYKNDHQEIKWLKYL